MRSLLPCLVFATACASSQPLYANDPGGMPVSTWQARHGNVLVMQCTLPAGVGRNDYAMSHGRKYPVFVEPPTRSLLVARHCTQVDAPDAAPGAPAPRFAMIYTPSAEQLWQIAHRRDHEALHTHAPSHH